jgi:hypothetical protein
VIDNFITSKLEEMGVKPHYGMAQMESTLRIYASMCRDEDIPDFEFGECLARDMHTVAHAIQWCLQTSRIVNPAMEKEIRSLSAYKHASLCMRLALQGLNMNEVWYWINNRIDLLKDKPIPTEYGVQSNIAKYITKK